MADAPALARAGGPSGASEAMAAPEALDEVVVGRHDPDPPTLLTEPHNPHIGCMNAPSSLHNPEL